VALALAALASAFGTALAGSSASAASSYTLHVGYIGTAGLFTGPEGYAYSTGQLLKWLKPAGVTAIQPAQFPNGPNSTAALVGGSLDLEIIGDTPGLLGQSEGAPAKLINQDRVGLPAWLVARKGITSLSQLEGKNVARQQGSYLDRYVQGLLAEKKLSGKINLIAMLNPVAITALRTGSLDAAVLTSSLAYPLAQQGYPVLDKSESHPELQGTTLTIASNSALAAHPGLTAAWNAARVKSIAYAKAHQSAYYAYEARAEGGSVPALLTFEQLSDYPTAAFTASGLKQLQATLNFLVSQKEAKAFSLPAWQAK
jgi:NitT/TauT family transport system substrate-binding protein/sulfonate transport system substrate-binding protein